MKNIKRKSFSNHQILLPYFLSWNNMVDVYRDRLLKFQDFKYFEIRIKVPARQLRTTISATVLFPCSRIWIWRAQCRRVLFRNEDKIAKRRSCGRQYNVFLYSVSSVATLRTPFPRNLGNYLDVSLTNVFREIGKTNPADTELSTLPRPPTLN